METTEVSTKCEECGCRIDNHDHANHPFIPITPIEVGDILDSSWGYDQTNIDFYLVTKFTKTMVYLQKIGARRVEDASQRSQDALLPDPDVKIGEPFRRKLSRGWGGSDYVSLTSYSGASKWTGAYRMETAAGWGH